MTPADLTGLMVRADAPHHRPLIAAIGAGDLACLMVAPWMPVPRRLLADSADHRPKIVILADDSKNATGPRGFPQVRRLLEWARVIVLHGTGGLPQDYAEALRATVQVRQVVLIETRSEHEAAWIARIARVASDTPQLRITVPLGMSHPIAATLAGEAMH